MIITIREFLEVPGKEAIANVYQTISVLSTQFGELKSGVQSATKNMYSLTTATSNRLRALILRVEALEATLKAYTEVELVILRREGAFELVKANPADACYDLCVLQDTYISGGEREAVDTGLVIAVPFNCEVQIRPRSGISANKAKSRMINQRIVESDDGKLSIVKDEEPFPKHLTIHLGTCDAGYRGEYKVIVENGNSEPILLRRGDKIAQVAVRTIPFTTERYVNTEAELPASDGRGAKGFNSSGTQARTDG